MIGALPLVVVCLVALGATLRLVKELVELLNVLGRNLLRPGGSPSTKNDQEVEGQDSLTRQPRQLVDHHLLPPI